MSTPQNQEPAKGSFEKLMDLRPAMEKLGIKKKPGIPVVQQTTSTDCGAACLAMVLGYLGRHVQLEEVRTGMSIGRDGVSARAILETASRYDLRGRGVRIEVTDLKALDRGAILHWNFSHFVVFDKVSEKGIHIVDPALGERVATIEETSRSFTGVALLFEKTDTFQRMGPKKASMWKRYRQMMSGSGSDDVRRVVITSVLLQSLALTLPLIHGRLVDRVLPRNDMHLMFVLVAAFFGANIFYFITAMTRSHIFTHVRTRFDAKLTLGFVEHMLKLPYGFFERRQPADLQMRISSVAQIRESLTGAVLSGMVDGTLVIGHLIFLLLMSVKMALVASAVVGVQATLFIVLRNKMLELSAGTIAKQTESAHALQELLNGMECLKSSGVEHIAARRWAGEYIDLLNINLRRGGVSNLSDALLGTMRVTGPTLLLLVGVHEVTTGNLSLGQMLSANAFAVGFIQPVMNLVGTLNNLQMVKAQFARIDDVLETPAEQEGGPRAAPQLKGEIILDRVTFKYSANLPAVVKNVTLHIRPGECIAIVGRSGSGKTTLGRLLLGLYPPSEGGVRYDGTPIQQLDLRSIRRQLGVVMQRPHIFGTSIRANIALADPAIPLDKVTTAATRACIDKDIARMPLGYDTPVVAGGASLSGGQRQRVALARALVHDPAILFLDEATSALDATTESEVQANLDKLTCTRILIAHRLSTVINAHRILVMEDGLLVEQGTHAELLAKRGAYAKLVAAQLGEHGGPALAPAAPGPSRPPAAAQSAPPPPGAAAAAAMMQQNPAAAQLAAAQQQMVAQARAQMAQLQSQLQTQIAAQLQSVPPAQQAQAQAQLQAQAQAQLQAHAAQLQGQMQAALQQQAQRASGAPPAPPAGAVPMIPPQAAPMPPSPALQQQAMQPMQPMQQPMPIPQGMHPNASQPPPLRASQAPALPNQRSSQPAGAPPFEENVTVARGPRPPPAPPRPPGAGSQRPAPGAPAPTQGVPGPALRVIGGGTARGIREPIREPDDDDPTLNPNEMDQLWRSR
jgi:ABC-type bacteriocin/lantibiotic exporter with double-glycine peptidase domain